jgi:hypothetical protein
LFVALLCTFSIFSISPTLNGDQTASAYSIWGLTKAWNKYLKLCSSVRYIYQRHARDGRVIRLSVCWWYKNFQRN